MVPPVVAGDLVEATPRSVTEVPILSFYVETHWFYSKIISLYKKPKSFIHIIFIKE